MSRLSYGEFYGNIYKILENSPFEDGYRTCQDTQATSSRKFTAESAIARKIPPRGQETVNMDLQISAILKKFIPKCANPCLSPATMLKFPDFTCLIHQKNSPLSAARVQASGAGLGNPQWLLSRTKGWGSCCLHPSDSETHHEWKELSKLIGRFQLMERVQQTTTHHKN